MRGATVDAGSAYGLTQISIHAPHARSDWGDGHKCCICTISIHAPHARSDASTIAVLAAADNFNPRSSCEERQFSDCRRRSPPSFQSTLLMRGATASCRSAHRGRHFNPRSSCEERRGSIPVNKTVTDFNPRSSCEERPSPALSADSTTCDFNPRSSCEERLSTLDPLTA